jgi:hypothetical protein
MNAPVSRPILAALLCVGAASFIDAAPSAVRIVGGIVLVCYLPGLGLLALLGDRRRPFLDYVYLPFMLSPVIGSLLAFACYAATGSVDRAWATALVLPVLLLFASLFMKREQGHEADSPVPRAILLISLAFGGILLVAYLRNTFLLYRADAWYHISIVNEISNRGIPPREPWLVDVPIRYMWVFHFFIAGFKKFSGLSAPWAMGVFNAINAFVFPYFIARLTALFRREKRFVLGAPLISIASLSSASWILWPVVLLRALSGEIKGSAEVTRIIHNISLDSHRVVEFFTPHGLWMVSLIDKFFVITAFNFALNLFLLCFITIASVERRARFDRGAITTAFIAFLGAFLFHIIVGVPLIAAAAGTGILLLLARLARSRIGEGFSSFHTIAVPCAGVVAAAIGFPYLLSLAGGAGGDGQAIRLVHFGIKNLLTMAAPLVILFPFSRAAFRELRTSASGAHRLLGIWLAILVALSLFVNLPSPNESKLVFPVFLLLTPLVAWQIIEALYRARGARLIALSFVVVVLFAIPSVLTVRGCMMEKPVVPIEKRRMGVTPEEREIFAWISARTPLDSAVIEGNVYNWMPVYAQRRDFFPDEGTVALFGYGRDPRMGRFREIRDHIFSEAPLREDDMTVLEKMKPDLYVVVWREDMERFPGIEERLTSAPGWFARVYGNPAGTVFRFMGSEAYQDRRGGSRAGT